MKIEKPRLKNWGKNTNRETELSKKKNTWMNMEGKG